MPMPERTAGGSKRVGLSRHGVTQSSSTNGGLQPRQCIANWRATVDEDGHYCFAITPMISVPATRPDRHRGDRRLATPLRVAVHSRAHARRRS